MTELMKEYLEESFIQISNKSTKLLSTNKSTTSNSNNKFDALINSWYEMNFSLGLKDS